MRTTELEFLNKYSEVKNKIENIYLHSDEITKFFQLYMKVINILKNEYNPELETLFRPIKKIFYELRSSIEDYNVKLEKIFTEEEWQQISLFFNEFEKYGEDYGEISMKLFQIISKIRKGKIENKSKEWLIELCTKNKGQTIAIVSNYPEYDAEIHKQFENIIFMKPNQLMKSLEIYDVLVFLGTPNFFKEFNNVFLGKFIYYVSYDFYRNEFKKHAVITPLHKKLNTLYTDVRVAVNERKVSLSPEIIEMINENVVDKNIPENIKSLTNNTLEDDNVIEARFIRLANNRGLIALKNSTLRVIELNEENGEVQINIIRKKINDISPADKIIITLHTNPTFLKEFSIKQLGQEKYELYIQLVNQYKTRLKEIKNKLGSYQRLMREMNTSGLSVSGLQVLKNWMGEKTVRPRQLKELLIYLNFEENEIIQILEAAKEINVTRRRAGRYKSKNITRLFKKIEGRVIEYNKAIYGEENFVFSIDELGTYTIETVVNIPKEIITVNTSELYKIQKI